MSFSQQNRNKPLLILGLDGMSYNIFSNFILSEIHAKLGDNYSLEKVDALLPYNTMNNWTSITTQVDCSFHGLPDFAVLTKIATDLDILSSKDLKASRFWESRKGSHLILNLPGTYPANVDKDVFIITGPLTPPKISSKCGQPHSFRKDFFSAYPNYKFDLKTLFEEDEATLFSSINKLLTTRINSFRYCFEMRKWDTIVAVVTEVDRFLHLFYTRNVDRYWKKLFDNLVKFIEFCLSYAKSRGYQLLMFSDHGFQEYNQNIHLPNILHNYGYLKLDRTKVRGNGKERTERRFNNFLSERPLVYPTLGSSYGIKVGDFQGKQKLLEELKTLFVTEFNEEVENVSIAQEWYSGPYLHRLPDLFVVPSEGYKVTSLVSPTGSYTSPSEKFTGHHSKEAFLFAYPSFPIPESKNLKTKDLLSLIPSADHN